MLKYLKINNFLSFAEPTIFDFSATRYSILSTTNVSSTNTLKGSLFIGPNASGKTNALKAIAFLIHLFNVLSNHFIHIPSSRIETKASHRLTFRKGCGSYPLNVLLSPQ